MNLKPGELVRPIEGYEGLYSITSHGRVWSCEKTVTIGTRGAMLTFGNKFMSPPISRGYFHVNLHNLGKVKNYKVSRLVVWAFIENSKGYSQVNHKDGNRLNNYAGTLENNFKDGNLEWCTRLQNQIHASVNGFWKNSTSKYPGVDFHKDGRKKPWHAKFNMNNKRVNLGHFTTEREAARVYYFYVASNYPDAFDLIKDKLKEVYKGIIDL